MRKSGFYPHLALTNILRNGQFYLPYFLTCAATIAMFYILCFLTYNDMIDTMPGAAIVQIILNLGCIVVALFSVVIISYTNGFIMEAPAPGTGPVQHSGHGKAAHRQIALL